MRKIIFRTLAVCTMAMLLLSSCLDDSETAIIRNSLFGYIQESSGVKYAITAAGRVTHTDLQNDNTISVGDCLFFNTKINVQNHNNNIYTAEYFEPIEGKIFPENTQVKADANLTFDIQGVNPDTHLYFVSTNIGETVNWSSNEFYGDRWHFIYSYRALEGEQAPKLIISYDPEKQYDTSGRTLPEGVRIIDLQLERQGIPPPETVSTRIYSVEVVANMSALRPELKEFMDKDTKTVELRFRYFKEDNNQERGYRINYEIPTKKRGFYYENSN